MTSPPTSPRLTNCGDCGVAPGQPHDAGCDVAACPECGHQRMGCAAHPTAGWGIWSGEWPGRAECREFGFLTSNPVIPEDLNRLAVAALNGELVWDRQAQRWVRAPGSQE